MPGCARYLVVQLMFAAILLHWDKCGACDETLKCEDGTEWCFDCTERDAEDNGTCIYARAPTNFLPGEKPPEDQEEANELKKQKTFCTTATNQLGPKLQDFLNDVLDTSFVIYHYLEQVRFGRFTPADFKCKMRRPKAVPKVEGVPDEAVKDVNNLLNKIPGDDSVVPLYLHELEKDGKKIAASTLKCFPRGIEMAQYVIKITRSYSLGIWAIIGIVIAVVFSLGCCACVLVAVIVLKKKENKRKRERALNAGNPPSEGKKSSAKPTQEKKKSSAKRKSTAEPEPEPEVASGWGAWFGVTATPAKSESQNMESATSVGADLSGVSMQDSAVSNVSSVSNA